MSLISWNCRGLGGSSTVRALNLLIRKYSPGMLFLCETKAAIERCNRVAAACKMEKMVCVEANGKAGGLCLMWRQEIQVTILSTSKWWIHAKIEHPVFEKSWQLLCVYATPYQHLKEKCWFEITNTVKNIVEPWVLIGDLNEIIQSNEKWGGRNYVGTSKSFLEDFVSNTDCIDLGFVGTP